MKKGSFISIILSLIILLLIGAISVFGYAIYCEITGEGSSIVDIGENGLSIGGYDIPIVSESTQTSPENIVYTGVEGSTVSTENQRYRYLYNQLNETAKTIYSKLYQNRENLKTGIYKIEFGNTFTSLLSKDGGEDKLKKEYQSAIEALLYDNPEIFYLEATNMYINIEKITRITGVKYNVYIDNGHKTNYLAEGFYSKEDVDLAENSIKQVRDEILSLTYGKSDYEKIKIIHDYLIDSIEYDTTLLQSNIYNIYGALVNKKCVCEGYAKAFQYLMNEIGIDNVLVIGTGTNSNNETENHAWNYIKLENNWYGIDVTWDDPIMIGGGKPSNKTRYQYFLKGSASFNKNHIESNTFTEGGQSFQYPTLSIYDYK